MTRIEAIETTLHALDTKLVALNEQYNSVGSEAILAQWHALRDHRVVLMQELRALQKKETEQ